MKKMAADAFKLSGVFGECECEGVCVTERVCVLGVMGAVTPSVCDMSVYDSGCVAHVRKCCVWCALSVSNRASLQLHVSGAL